MPRGNPPRSRRSMPAPVTVLLLAVALLAARGSEGVAQPFVKCHSENGPSSELMTKYNYTPSDIFSLSAEIVEEQGMNKFNITWILNDDGSITYLNATKICVSRGAALDICIRCDYSEKFESPRTSDNQKWQFNYVGFSVKESTQYFISAYNIPPANPKEDVPKKFLNLISPDCTNNIMKHSNNCIEMGSLWNPNISACYTESEVEVNFTASSLCLDYSIYLYPLDRNSDSIRHPVSTAKGNDSRVFVRKPVNGQTLEYLELIPFFPKCGNDCKRHQADLAKCENRPVSGSVPTDPIAAYVCTVAALLLIVCVLAAVLYFKRRHDTAKNWVFLYPTMKQIPATVLIVYPQDVCFQHTVLGFAEFLHGHCQSEVIMDAWQKRRIAEIGPVQWFATQREIADKIIFLSAGATSAACDSACKRTVECHKDSESMFTIAFNLFCSDLKNQSSLQKYMVVSFNETNLAESLPSPLNSWPKYVLMKDMESFCRDLSRNLRNDEGTNSKCSWRYKMNLKL